MKTPLNKKLITVAFTSIALASLSQNARSNPLASVPLAAGVSALAPDVINSVASVTNALGNRATMAISPHGAIITDDFKADLETKIDGNVTVHSGATFTTSQTVLSGGTLINGDATFEQKSDIGGDADIRGNATLSSFHVSTGLTAAEVDVELLTEITGGLDVREDATFNASSVVIQ